MQIKRGTRIKFEIKPAFPLQQLLPLLPQTEKWKEKQVSTSFRLYYLWGSHRQVDPAGTLPRKTLLVKAVLKGNSWWGLSLQRTESQVWGLQCWAKRHQLVKYIDTTQKLMFETVSAADPAVSGVLHRNSDRVHLGLRTEQHPDHKPPNYYNTAGNRKWKRVNNKTVLHQPLRP